MSIPCEFCDHIVPAENYELHAARCYMMHLIRGDFDEGGDNATETEDEHEHDDGGHTNVLEAYITSNRQLHRANLSEFLDTHHSPPEPSGVFMERYLRERMRRMPAGTNSGRSRPRGQDPAYGTYEANMDLAERLGKVEIGVKDIGAISTIVSTIDNVDKAGVCAVCQSTFEEITTPNEAASSSTASTTLLRRLNCDHTFCAPCIERWLSKNKTCPVCLTEY